MAVEYRSGRAYYYSKVRVGGKVKSVYRGSGALGELCQFLAEEDQYEREALAEARREEAHRMKREYHEKEAALLALCRESDSAFSSFMLANGYHNHRGQWRKI